MTGPIVVTDGEQRAALAVVRSLGKAGHRVIVCSRSGRSLAGASRFAAFDRRVPDPLARPDGFVGALQALCNDEDPTALIPITDGALEAVLPARERFGPVRIPFPSLEAYRDISDKRALMGRARDLGIPTPAEATVERKGHAPAEGSIPGFPVVVKPARSVIQSSRGRQKVSVRYAEDPRELQRVLDSYPNGAYPLLIQEYVSGWGEGVFLLRWDGRTVARFAHRRIREKPPSGGASVYRASIPLTEELVAMSTSLLESYDWKGVAMIEFRRSKQDGRAYLMEINGRFWGSLQLAVDAGVDFPRLLVECASGRPPATAPTYRPGIRSRWWLGDLDHLILRLRGHPDGGRLPPGSGSALHALGQFLLPWRPGDRSEVLRLSDPRPGLRELRGWIGDVAGRKRRAS